MEIVVCDDIITEKTQNNTLWAFSLWGNIGKQVFNN